MTVVTAPRMKHALTLLAGTATLALSANAHALLGGILPPVELPRPVLEFEFVGEVLMYQFNGRPVRNGDGETEVSAVSGPIYLDTVTFGGTASMSGIFLGRPYTAEGPVSAYVGLLNPDQCAGSFMCAHANIDFAYNGAVIPVMAAFGMDPVIPGLTDLPGLNIGAEFTVASIDTDGNGIPGTAIGPGYSFSNFSPYFSGIATLKAIHPLGAPIANENINIPITPVPEPSEWMMLMAGLGLVSAAAIRRRRSLQR